MVDLISGKTIFGVVKLLYQEVNDLKYIEIKDNRSSKNAFIVSDKAQLESFKIAIKKDIGDLSYQEIVYSAQRALFIRIIDTKDKNISYALISNFTNTIDWIVLATPTFFIDPVLKLLPTPMRTFIYITTEDLRQLSTCSCVICF